jgi:hypothetical protein
MPRRTSAVIWQVDARRARKRYRLRITISQPFKTSRFQYACELRLGGITSEIVNSKIYGSDALQALVLCLVYLRSRLDSLTKSGFELFYEGSDEPLRSDIYFDAFKSTA